MFMEHTSEYLYQNVYMSTHWSFTKNQRDLLCRVQFLASFNIIESWPDGVHRERHLPDGELRGNDMIEARGLIRLDQVFENADIFGPRNLNREEF